MRRMLWLLYLVITSCGYHWGVGGGGGAVSINIPYARGDVDGLFTTTLIRRICETPPFQYRAEEGGLSLKITLFGEGSENIGYRHDRDEEDHPKKTILPTEGREKIQAEVILFDSYSQKILWGPLIVEAEADYDFITEDNKNDLTFINAEKKREPVLFFSMGQLEPAPSAQEAAKRVVYDRLAKKIVHLMVGEWKRIYEENNQ